MYAWFINAKIDLYEASHLQVLNPLLLKLYLMLDLILLIHKVNIYIS
jgi:hypothetical protein